MKVTPLDIRRKEFKRSVRGYSDEEVDLFLDEVADEFERLFQENVELQERITRLEEQVAGQRQLRDALEKTLVSAQLQADETRANARKESELILRDAELKARGIVSDSYAETQRVQQALIQLKHLEEDFRFKFRSLLEGHLKLLDEAPIDLAAAPAGGRWRPRPPEGEGTPFVVPAAVEEVPEYAAGAGAARAEVAGVVASDAASGCGRRRPPPPRWAPLWRQTCRRRSEPLPPCRVQPPPKRLTALELDRPGRRESVGTAETVEQARHSPEFDKAEAEHGVIARGRITRPESREEDPLTGSSSAGSSDDVDDVFLDADEGGKSKARDFEW